MKKRYWLKGLTISLILPVLFFIYAVVKVERGFEGFAYLLTAELAIVSGIIGIFAGWLYGKIVKNPYK
ncbi:MAG: hypothetical protein G01um101472_33 [Parcubacteria group bacterium Gr01-1014_72]|nr:MAG: hypothetical protein G01um101472_33 [Parcubacteria group bacterium Gr01-1014_72]